MPDYNIRKAQLDILKISADRYSRNPEYVTLYELEEILKLPFKEVLVLCNLLVSRDLIVEDFPLINDKTILAMKCTADGYAQAQIHAGDVELDWGRVINKGFTINNHAPSANNFGLGGANVNITSPSSDVKLDYQKMKELFESAFSETLEISNEDDKEDIEANLKKLENAAKEGKVKRFFDVSSQTIELVNKLVDVSPKAFVAIKVLLSAAGIQF